MYKKLLNSRQMEHDFDLFYGYAGVAERNGEAVA